MPIHHEIQHWEHGCCFLVTLFSLLTLFIAWISLKWKYLHMGEQQLWIEWELGDTNPKSWSSCSPRAEICGDCGLQSVLRGTANQEETRRSDIVQLSVVTQEGSS
jgi:hypothetical protein